jgi:hypothetical protein
VTTFAEAQATVLAWLEENWGTNVGTPYVSPEGRETAADWIVFGGAREYLRDGDPDYKALDDTAHVVSKTTGVHERINPVGEPERFAGARDLTPRP